MADVRFSKVTKSYPGGVQVFNSLSLVVAPGECLSVVGPSGCGKTTLLRLAAGLDVPTAGEVRLGGRVVSELSPRNRRVSMAFQIPALYPHLTVRDNLGFPLRYQLTTDAEIWNRVTELASKLQIESLLKRKPHELSGGQRQRVALGRCLVARPVLLLLDEPLSQLDVPLRAEVRSVILSQLSAYGTTAIWVTHDPEEARLVSNRVLSMGDGSPVEM